MQDRHSLSMGRESGPLNAPFQLLYPRLVKLTAEYKPKESQMPWTYQWANPDGRPLHNDFTLFRDTSRIEFARRVPLPLKGIKGTFKKVLKRIDPGYPTPPDTVIVDHEYYPGLRAPHVLVDYAEEGWSEFAFWHHDHWEPCVRQYMKTIKVPLFGTRTLKFYSGLKADVTFGDWMGYIEPAMSFLPTKER